MKKTGFAFILLVSVLSTISCCKDVHNDSTEFDTIADTISIQCLNEEMLAVRDYVPQYANIAHRGTTYWAPEETESSWRWARHMGTDYLEADIQCSKDAILLAVHDNSFSRTTDIDEVFLKKFPSQVRRVFYRSFRNSDGSQHFSDDDIEAQVTADSLAGVANNARDYYYAEILMLDAGKWFNDAYPDRSRSSFSGDGSSLRRTLESDNRIVYSNCQYVSALTDLISYASGMMLDRDSEGRRILDYGIKPGFENMTLKQIRERSEEQRGTILNGCHYSADERYMDFVEYEFDKAYLPDYVECGNKPGIYIEFKNSALQPLDIEARTYLLLDSMGWNIITKPSNDEEFYKNGCVNVGNTNGKVILQTFRLEAVERVEKVFEGKIPMCYLVDDEPPTDWDPYNYFDDPYNAVKVIDYAINHKCHIIGPSIDGEPNNYPNRCNSWQETLIHRASMLEHAWSIDTPDQMQLAMDGLFTNRTEMTLQWLIDNGRRPSQSSVPSPTQVLNLLGYK